MAEASKVRVDKWLWSVRAYKSRTLATDACNAGKVKINGKSVKASRLIDLNEEVHFQRAGNRKIYKVTALLEKRVSASLAATAYEDLSPPEIKNEKMGSAFVSYPSREKGAGRPTKKDRRGMNKFKGNL